MQYFASDARRQQSAASSGIQQAGSFLQLLGQAMQEGLLKEALSSGVSAGAESSGSGGGIGSAVASAVSSGAGRLGSALSDLFTASSLASLVQLTDDELVRLCAILCTAEYCSDTTAQLDTKLRERIDAPFASRISFSTEIDMFQKCACLHQFSIYTHSKICTNVLHRTYV